MSDEPKNIHEAIWAVMKEVGYVQKERSAKLSYSFAGEAALIGALRPAMVKYGITMSVVDIPDFTQEAYKTDKGTSMLRTSIRAAIRFTHAPSGTSIDVQATGEGADSGDKSANKALTGAYKYALRQTFMIETGDDPDTTSSEESARGDGQHKSRAGSAVADHSREALQKYATSRSLTGPDITAALKAAGITAFDPNNWEAMVKAVDSFQKNG